MQMEINKKTIAVIDDDIYIGDMLERVLRKNDYEVLRAYSGTEALYLLSEHTPDLILLDLMLPGLSGEELLPKIKDIPVMIVSAKIDVANKVDLLLKGAVDYITKPFDINELLARIIVQLRSAERSVKLVQADGIEHNQLRWKDIVLDLDMHVVSINQQEVRLTRTEYAILKLLMQNPAQVITKSQLLDRISADTPDCTENSLKMHMSNLRKKMRTEQDEDYIESVWGIGYKFD